MKSEISPAVSNNTLGTILLRRGGRYCIIIKVRARCEGGALRHLTLNLENIFSAEAQWLHLSVQSAIME